MICRRCRRQYATVFLLLHEDSKNSKASFFFSFLKWCATFTIILFTVNSPYNQVFCSFINSANSLDDACKMLHSSFCTSHIIHPVAYDAVGTLTIMFEDHWRESSASWWEVWCTYALYKYSTLQCIRAADSPLPVNSLERHTDRKKKKIFCQLKFCKRHSNIQRMRRMFWELLHLVLQTWVLAAECRS